MLRRVRRPAWLLALIALPVVAAFLGPPAWPVATVVRGSAGGDQTSVVLAATDAGALAVWEDTRRNARGVPDLYATPLSAEGAVQDLSGRPLVLGAYNVREPRLACVAGVCLLAWTDRQGISAMRLSEQGAPLDAQATRLAVGTSYAGPEVLATADAFLVAWSFGSTLSIARVGLDGSGLTVTDSALEPGDVTREVVFAGGDAGILVAWKVDRGDGGAAVLAGPLDGQDSLDAGFALVIADGSRGLRMSSDGVGWLLAWINPTGTSYGQAFATRLGPDGTPLDVPPLVLSGTDIIASLTTIFDGRDYVAAWYADNNPSADLFSARIAPDSGAFAAVPLSADRTGREFPALLATGRGLLAAWNTYDTYYELFELKVGMVVDGGLSPPSGRPLTSTGDAHERPRLIWTGQGATLVVTANHMEDAGLYELQLVPLGPDGTPLGPPVSLEGVDDRLFSAAVGFDGTSYVAAYREWPELHVRGFTPAGRVNSPDFMLANNFYSGFPATFLSGPQPLLIWSHYVGGPDGTVPFAVRWRGQEPVDALPLRLTTGMGWNPAAVPTSYGYVVAFDAPDGVTTARLFADGRVEPGVVIAPPSGGTPPRTVAMGGNGVDQLVVWAETNTGYPTLTGQRIDAQGQPVGPALALFSRSDAPWSQVYTSTVFSTVWTGFEFLVAFEVDNADAGSQRDLWMRRVSAAGDAGPFEVLSASPYSEEQPSLTLTTPGRVLVTYLEYQPLPGADAMRARTRLLADVPDRFECFAPTDCRSSTCVRGVCCSPSDGGCDHPTLLDGGLPNTDGGSSNVDGGSGGGARHYQVGCGCSGGSPDLLAWVAGLLALVRGRRARRRR
jgi:hypothetical protein